MEILSTNRYNPPFLRDALPVFPEETNETVSGFDGPAGRFCHTGQEKTQAEPPWHRCPRFPEADDSMPHDWLSGPGKRWMIPNRAWISPALIRTGSRDLSSCTNRSGSPRQIFIPVTGGGT